MRGTKARAQKRDAKIKGRLVEQIVAQIHRVRGVRVDTNVRLPSSRTPTRRREVDVLLTTHVLGYEVRLAFECKNYDRVTDVTKIGEFADKLNDVGIPTQSSFFVSANGFTTGALDRARQLGMGTLLLAGLSADRLGSLVIDALQSIIYLLPVVTEYSVVNDAQTMKSHETWLWFDEAGRPLAQTPDLLWHRWRDGEPPSVIGRHEIQVQAPGWSQRVEGRPVVPVDVRFKVHVYGLVASFEGQANDHALIDAFDRQMRKRQVSMSFDTRLQNMSMRLVESEEVLDQFIQGRPETLKLITRVRLPRLQWGELFWPISERVQLRINQLAEHAKPGETISREDFVALEQDPEASIWEAPAAIPPKPAAQ